MASATMAGSDAAQPNGALGAAICAHLAQILPPSFPHLSRSRERDRTLREADGAAEEALDGGAGPDREELPAGQGACTWCWFPNGFHNRCSDLTIRNQVHLFFLTNGPF